MKEKQFAEEKRKDEGLQKAGMPVPGRRKLLATLGAAGAALAAHTVLSKSGLHAEEATVTRDVYDRLGKNGYPPGQAMNNGVIRLTYGSVADMTADSLLADGMLVSTAGYYEPGDGGAANYIIKAGSEPEDGGSVINLQHGGLQAILLPDSGICYKQFGAVCDGVNDDGVQIKKAHAYANSRDLPIINLSGEFWIKQTNDIIIQTNTYWGNTKFHIDEVYNSRTIPRFRVTSRKSATTIQLDAAAKASLLSKLKPGTTFIPELAPYKNCMIFVVDSNDKIGVRYGYNHNGWNKEDFFYVEEHGRILGDIAWTFNDYTSLVAYPCEDSYLTIDGGTFYMSGDDTADSSGAYVHDGIMVRRSRTVIRNQWVGLEPGKTDVSLDAHHGFYFFNYVFDVTLENVRLIPREKDREGTENDVPQGTYGIGGSRVLNATFRNVTSEGGNVHWGVFGTNLFKNFRVEECRLNRVDVHFHCWNLYVKDCEIGYKGFTLTGGGDLFIENTKRFGNQFISFRNDYGARWDGNIRLRNCRLVITNGSGQAVALQFTPANFDYKYPIGYGRTVKVEDFIFDYTGVSNPTGICRIMQIANFSKINGTNDRVFFPQSIEFSDVRAVGREKGVRILEIANPLSFHLGKPGGYDDNKITPNCHMRFVNIQGEKVPPQTSQSTANVNFLLNALSTAQYEDEYALYPKIEIINCGDFFGHFKGAVADVYINGCTVNCVDAYEGGPMRGRIVFDNCDIQADALDDGKQLYNLSPTLGATFINCTIHAPIVDGQLKPDLLYRYEFIKPNDTLKHNHLNTKLSKQLVDYFANSGTPIEQEFYDMLKNKTDADSHLMARRKGTTAQRPEPSRFKSEIGFVYFDTDLGVPVFWNGSTWVNPFQSA